MSDVSRRLIRPVHVVWLCTGWGVGGGGWSGGGGGIPVVGILCDRRGG